MLAVRDSGGVAIVEIDRPPVNAMDPGLLQEGLAVLDRLERELPDAVVIAGRPGSFSAGLDLKAVPDLDDAGRRDMVTALNELFTRWYGFPRPVVCAVTGHAIAGGCILALCGDHRVGGASGRFGLTEVRVGVPYPAAAIAVVRAELSAAAARELALRAHLVDAAAAEALGILDERVEDEEVVARAQAVATELAELPYEVYAITKRQLRGEVVDRLLEITRARTDPLLSGWIPDA
jgi:enoyl-CoA hydratase